MNVSCPGCSASYFVDEMKIPMKGGRLTCTTCGTRWDIHRPGTGGMERAAAPSTPGAAPSPAPEDLTATVVSNAARHAGGAPATYPLATCPKCGHRFRPDARSRPPQDGTVRTVLLVEDQKYFTEVAREALGPGYRTISASSKDEAMRVIAAEAPSLLILDLSLARGQDGRELLRSLPGKRFPILIFTALDETELLGDHWEELKRLGADDVVHKGMNVGEELKKKVAELLDAR